jgi:hypothetical protein
MEAHRTTRGTVRTATADPQPGDFVVHWQSSFGVIVIEVRGGHVYVNGDLVEVQV